MSENKLLEIVLEHYWAKDASRAEYRIIQIPNPNNANRAKFEISDVLKQKITDDLTAKEYCELIKSAYVNEALSKLGLERGESREGATPQSFTYTNKLEPGAAIYTEIDLAGFGRIWLTIDASEKERLENLVALTHEFMGKLKIPFRE